MEIVSQPSSLCNKITKEHKEERLNLTLNSQAVISVGFGAVA